MLVADVTKPSTYVQLREQLEGEKVDVIFERMAGGMQLNRNLPVPLLQKTVGRWYEMLREGGMMFVQVPYIFNESVDKWAIDTQRQYPNVLDVVYKQGDPKARADSSPGFDCVLYIHKLQGAPERLPSLSEGPSTDKAIDR